MVCKFHKMGFEAGLAASLIAALALLQPSASWADITVTSNNAPAFAEQTEEMLEANDGLVIGDFSDFRQFNYDPSTFTSFWLTVDDRGQDDGFSEVHITGNLDIGEWRDFDWVRVEGAGARLKVDEGVDVSALLYVNDGDVLSYGPIQPGAAGGIGAINISGANASITSVAVAPNTDGGRIVISGGSTGFFYPALMMEGGAALNALSQIESVDGAGTVSIEKNAVVHLRDAGTQLSAQHQIAVSANNAQVRIESGAAWIQSGPNTDAPGLAVAAADPGYADIFIDVRDPGSRISTQGNMHIINPDMGTTKLRVMSGAAIETAGNIILGNANGAAAAGRAVLDVWEGGTVTAQEVIVHQGGQFNGSADLTPFGWGLDRNHINADVTLAGGSFQAGPSPVTLNGNLDASQGTLSIMAGYADELVTVNGTVLFGEGTLLRVIVEAIPAGGEILIDRYLMADRYEFSPQFSLAAQLEVQFGRMDVINPRDLIFRFAAADQTFRYSVPELGGHSGGLALALMLTLFCWRTERRRTDTGSHPHPTV